MIIWDIIRFRHGQILSRNLKSWGIPQKISIFNSYSISVAALSYHYAIKILGRGATTSKGRKCGESICQSLSMVTWRWWVSLAGIFIEDFREFLVTQRVTSRKMFVGHLLFRLFFVQFGEKKVGSWIKISPPDF